MSSQVEDCCQALLRELLPQMDGDRSGLCLDVGVGTFAFYCEQFARLGFTTIAIEPLPIPALRQLCQAQNITLLEQCLSDVNGTQTLYVGSWRGTEDVNYSSLSPDWFGSSAIARTVPSSTLLQLLEERKPPKVTCLKLDIEGAEATVIRQLPHLPPALLPQVVMFEYGGGDYKAKGIGGWAPKFWQGTQDCLRVLRDCGYQGAIVVDGAWGVPEILVDLQRLSDPQLETIFHPQAAWGNIIAFHRQPCPEAEVVRICALYHDGLGGTVIPAIVPNPPTKTVTVATSISPGNLEAQRAAIESWQALGFGIISLNSPEEISLLRSAYPEVTFQPVERDARATAGKPLVYISDLVTYLKQSQTDLGAIINSDIQLKADPTFKAFILDQTQNSLVVCSRVEVESIAQAAGPIYTRGFDAFFFSPGSLPSLPANPFCLGLPWWDFWLPLMAQRSGLPLKYLTTPLAYHLHHDANYSNDLWLSLGLRFLEDFDPAQGASLQPLLTQNPTQLRQELLQVLERFIQGFHQGATRIAWELPPAWAGLGELNPEAAALHWQAGQIHQHQGRVEAAIASYHRSLAPYPDYGPSHLALAELSLQAGNLDQALAHLERVQVCQPELLTVAKHLQCGQLFQAAGAWAIAQRHGQQALALDPDAPEVHLFLAGLFTHQGDYGVALDHAQGAIRLSPAQAQGYWQQALIVEQQAIAAQQQALDLDPTLAPLEAQFEMGVKFADQGRLDWAIRAYHRVIRLKPDWAEAHCNLGNALSAQGKLAEAAQSLRRAIAFNPGLTEAFSNLGNTLTRLGEFDQALQYHQQAIRLRPDWAELHYNLADALVQHNRSGEALFSLKEALRLKPNLFPAQQLWARLQGRLG